MSVIKGRVRKFGNNIDTDNITAGSTLILPIEEIKLHVFEPISPGFHKTVKEGDIIVAGKNFGCGSSREQATEVIKLLGIKYIVCESMARIYFRNCIALGLYPVFCKEAGKIFDEENQIEIDLDNSTVKNITNGETAPCEPLTGLPLQIVKAGGQLALLKIELEKSQ